MSTFALNITAFVEKAKGRGDLVVRKVCLDVFRRVILRTPVDTGRARANWQADVGSLPSGVTNSTDPAGSQAVSQASSVALSARAGDVVYLANNLPYILPLENGHSQQAPNGMVARTVEEYQQIVNKAAGEAQQEAP